MLSIQFITRNLRRAASLRGFSSASVSEKSVIADKSKKVGTQSQKSKACKQIEYRNKMRLSMRFNIVFTIHTYFFQYLQS